MLKIVWDYFLLLEGGSAKEMSSLQKNWNLWHLWELRNILFKYRHSHLSSEYFDNLAEPELRCTRTKLFRVWILCSCMVWIFWVHISKTNWGSKTSMEHENYIQNTQIDFFVQIVSYYWYKKLVMSNFFKTVLDAFHIFSPRKFKFKVKFHSVFRIFLE